MGKTVFFGGTFNPPHNAHREMLEVVSNLSDVERILVAPTNIPPHKATPSLFASAEDRLNMCRLLSVGINKAEVSDIEMKREGKSYSFYTLSELKGVYPELAMLIGGDMLTSFTQWFNYKGILELAELIAVRRKDVDNEKFDRETEDLRSLGGRVTVIETDLPCVSSTEIRGLISSGNDGLRTLVPQNICDYIRENKIYGGVSNDC